jgi:hypothetical protein
MNRVTDREVSLHNQRCITALKLSLTRLRTEFDAYRKSEAEAKIHIERENLAHFSELNNKTAWVDRQQAEMKAEFVSMKQYLAEYRALDVRIKANETARDQATGRNTVLSGVVALFISLLAILLNLIISGTK